MPVGLFDHPPFGLGHETDIGRVALDDLHVHAERGTVVDGGPLEALVDQDFLTVSL